MDNSVEKKMRRARELESRIEESEDAQEVIQETAAERQAKLAEMIRQKNMKYEDLPGTPKRIKTFLKLSEIRQHRNFDCEYYNDCLGYAAVHNWPSMSCRECRHA
jgi:hypothetical protein